MAGREKLVKDKRIHIEHKAAERKEEKKKGKKERKKETKKERN